MECWGLPPREDSKPRTCRKGIAKIAAPANKQSRIHEPRRAQAQKLQSSKQYRTFDRSRPHRTRHLASFGKSRSLPRRNKKMEKQKNHQQRHHGRRLGPKKEAKRRNHGQTPIQVGRTLHSAILQQAKILSFVRPRRKSYNSHGILIV